jgi:N-acetylneuraminic acid mutarotase
VEVTPVGEGGRLGAVRRAWLVPVALLADLALAGCSGDARPTGAPGSSASSPRSVVGLSWQRLASLPSQRTEVAAAVADGKVYLLGGYHADGATVSTVEVYDPAAGRWSLGPDLPLAANHAMAATAAATVLVFGGYRADGAPSTAAFRLRAGGWQRVADLPEGRAAGTAVAVGERVYLAGGIAPGGRLATQMLVYDVSHDRWSTVPGLPTPREHLGGAGFGGRLYTVGGRTSAGNLATVEVYDPGTGRWERLADLPTPRGGLAAAATCSGLVVAVGGEAAATFKEAEALDTGTGTWRALPPMPTPRHGLGVVAIGTVLYTLSGGRQPGLHVSDAAEAIDLAPLGVCR